MKSPNFNDRKLPISLLVLHYTGMETGEAACARLCDEAAQVSAHYVLHEDGKIETLVDEDHRAWHALFAKPIRMKAITHHGWRPRISAWSKRVAKAIQKPKL